MAPDAGSERKTERQVDHFARDLAGLMEKKDTRGDTRREEIGGYKER
jgi:hypothetical protein